MKRTAFAIVAIALFGGACITARAVENLAVLTEPVPGRTSSMSDQKITINLFNRWERVWHEGRFDLVPSCVADIYIRHDGQTGDRTVTRESYAAEIAQIQKDRPGIRVVVFDHSFNGDRAWFRFEFKWTNPKSGEAHTQAGMQSYRMANGRLAETWLSMQPLGSAWSDAVAQQHWTSPPPIK